MDDFYGLDPLDRWLNSRQGKQRAVLNWFPVFMLAFYFGMLGWLTWVFFGSPSLIAVPVIALAAAVAAVPLKRLAPAMHAWRSRRHPDKTGPQFTWRWMAIAIAFAIEEVVSAIDESVGQSLPHGPRGALDLLQGIVALSVFPLLLTMHRYTRRYTRARLERSAGSAAFEDPYRHARPPWEAGS